MEQHVRFFGALRLAGYAGVYVLGAAFVAATLSGVAGWWLTLRRLWFYLGLFIASVSVVLSLSAAVMFEEPLIGGLPPPFGAVLMAGIPLLAYLVPRSVGPTRSTP